MFWNTSKHFPVITHGPFMKYLGVGGSRADVMMTVSALPGAEGILQERNP